MFPHAAEKIKRHPHPWIWHRHCFPKNNQLPDPNDPTAFFKIATASSSGLLTL